MATEGEFGFSSDEEDTGNGVEDIDPQSSLEACASDPDDVINGFLFKLGAVRKNWKIRWMVLRRDGILYYFKKQPNKFTASEVVIPLLPWILSTHSGARILEGSG
eukprot:m.165805 g.165805  ORF g.165805 m.165805 type:complete len:105 (-) comp15266_c0_seq9:3046-3360(-)